MRGQKISLGLFLVLFLSSCGTGDEPTPTPPNTSVETPQSNKSFDNVNLKTYGMEKERFDELKKQTDPDTLRLAFLQKPKSNNPITQMTADFFKKVHGVTPNNITTHTEGGSKKSDLEQALSQYDPSLVRSFTLELQIHDNKTKQPIKSGTVFVNGVSLGSLSDGMFSGELKWLQGAEIFNIMVRSPKYADAFLSLNSLNSRADLLMGQIGMEPASFQSVTLGKSQEITIGKLSLKVKECTLVDKDGKCYAGKSQIKATFLNGNEANQGDFSLDMTAVTNEGEVVVLRSGGMAFIEFLTDNGEILQLKSGETIDFTYQVTPTDISTMSNSKYGNGEKNGYWYFNKLAGVWQESSAKTVVDPKNNTVSITADVLY